MTKHLTSNDYYALATDPATAESAVLCSDWTNEQKSNAIAASRLAKKSRRKLLDSHMSNNRRMDLLGVFITANDLHTELGFHSLLQLVEIWFVKMLDTEINDANAYCYDDFIFEDLNLHLKEFMSQ